MQDFSKIRNEWFVSQVKKLEEQGIYRAEIARKLDVLPQYLSPFFSPKSNRHASEKFVKKFCDVFGINHNDLLNKMKSYENTTETTAKVEKGKVEYNAESKGIPLVELTAAAGFGNGNFAIEKHDVKDYYIIPKFKHIKVDFMIETHGSSMIPKYNSGDVIACSIIKDSKFIQWNKCHVIATIEQGILVKRIRQADDDGCILAISDNPDYPPFLIPKDEITGIALVVGVIRLE
jgi:phage repressor protein C with HTH and peptisase S24 domain